MEGSQNIKFNFKDQVVLVTGCSGWIGYGIAESFAHANANLILHSRKENEAVSELEKSILDNGGQVMCVYADLTQSHQVELMFEKIYDRFSFVNILINNAGIYPNSLIIEMQENEWDEVITTNMKSVFLCTKNFANKLINKNMGGAIVNIDSIEALDSTRGHSHYDATKAGLVMFTRVSALELGQYDIRVNSVGPGLVNSPNLKTWPEGKKRWMDKVPLKRLCERNDIANACMFFASTAASFISGAHLIVDGGMLTNERY